MKRSAFHRWMGQVGLLAALLLLVVPTAGRIVHAVATSHAVQAGAHDGHGAPGGGGTHHGHAPGARSSDRADAHRDERGGPDTRPAIGDPDCDYCPLLSTMAGVAAQSFVLAQVPTADRPSAQPTVPPLRWRHPWGLGSRGPP